jgi:phosphomethylpyrimidine synthase
MSRSPRAFSRPGVASAKADAPSAVRFYSMKITEGVRKYAAEQELSEDEALRAGMEQKSREFRETGAEIHSEA